MRRKSLPIAFLMLASMFVAAQRAGYHLKQQTRPTTRLTWPTIGPALTATRRWNCGTSYRQENARHKVRRR